MQQKADIIYTDHSSWVRYPSRPSPGRRSRNSSFDEADADDEPLLSASPTIKPANGHSTAYPSPSQSPEPQLPGLSSPPPTLWYLFSGLLQHNYGLTALLLALLLVALPPYLVHLHYTEPAVPTVDPVDSSSALHSFHPADYLPKTVDPVLPVTTRDSRSDAPSSAFIASASIDRTHLAKPFAAIDAAFAALHRWPRVDLLVRTFHGSAMFLPLLFQSIDAFWPHNIGRCLIVADAFSETDEKVLAYRHLIPDWCELHYESVPPEMIHNGRWTMQWSNFWADNYTTPDAQFVAIADTDSFFTHKVTPDMYFDARGRVIHVLHPNYQRQFWDKDTLWWLGTKDEMVAHNAEKGWTNDALLNELYPLNFMQNLPQIYPVEAFAAFRDYTIAKHATNGATLPYFDALNAHFLRTAYGNPSQFCLLGNFLGFFSSQHIRDKVSLVLSDNRQLPAGATRVERAHQLVLRPTMHMPYTDIYNTGQLFPKIVCDRQRFDYTKVSQAAHHTRPSQQ